MPRAASFERQRLGRAVQRRPWRRRSWPARGCRPAPPPSVMLTMRPQRVRTIGSSSGWVTRKKPLQVGVDDVVPRFGAHAGHQRVVVDAGVVDQDLDRAVGEQLLDGGLHAARRRPGRRRSRWRCRLRRELARRAPARARAALFACTMTCTPLAASARQIAAPMSPLPPVTSARLRWRCAVVMPGSAANATIRRPLRDRLPASCDREGVQAARRDAAEQLGADGQRAAVGANARGVQLDVASAWPACRRAAPRAVRAARRARPWPARRIRRRRPRARRRRAPADAPRRARAPRR